MGRSEPLPWVRALWDKALAYGRLRRRVPLRCLVLGVVVVISRSCRCQVPERLDDVSCVRKLTFKGGSTLRLLGFPSTLGTRETSLLVRITDVAGKASDSEGPLVYR